MTLRDAQIAVGRMYTAKQRLAAIDPVNEPLSWPKVSMGEGAVAEVEQGLGHRLPSSLRDYYLAFDKWEQFRTSMVLLGVRDLLPGTPDYTMARGRLAAIGGGELSQLGGVAGDWMVVAFDRDDIDLYLVHRVTGRTVWLAGGVIETYEGYLALLHDKARFCEAQLESMMH